MTLTLEDIKALAAAIGSVIVTCGGFFLWLSRLVIQQAIAEADKDLHGRIDELREYVDHTFVTAATLDQLSKRVDDIRG